MLVIFVFTIYLILLFYILVNEPLVLIGYYFLFFAQTYVYASVVYLDQGGMLMPELGIISRPAYTSLIVFLFNIIALLIILVLFRLNKRRLKRALPIVEHRRIPYIKTWILGFYVIELILIANVVLSGSPLWVLSVNKTTFWTIAKFPFLAPLSSQLNIIAVFSGMFLLNNELKRKSKLIRIELIGVFALLMIYLILLGHKFGQPVTIIILFFMPILIYESLLKRISIKKFVYYALIVVAVLAVPIVYFYTRHYGDIAFVILRERIFSMQGQLAYSAIQNYLAGNIPNGLHQLGVEIRYILGLVSNDTYVGMTYSMSEFMPSALFKFYLSQHVNMAGGYISILLLLYNNLILALLIHIIFIALFFFSGYLMILSIMKYDLLLTFIYLKIYFSFISYYSAGYTTAIFNIENLVYVLLIIIITIVRYGSKQRRKREEVPVSTSSDRAQISPQ